MAIEPIKGFYVHDEATDTDGIAKVDWEGIANAPGVEAVIGATKNLFDVDNARIVRGYINTSTGKIAANNDCAIVYVPCEKSTTYTVSKTAGTRFTVASSTTVPEANGSVTGAIANNSGSSITITTTATSKYLLAWVWNGSSDTSITEAEMLASVQIEKGATATEYEPYSMTAVDTVARASLDSFGFLSNATLLTSNTDLNDLDYGVYLARYSSVAQTLVNTPITNSALKVICFERNDGKKSQVALGGSGRAYFRSEKSDGWYDWSELGSNVEHIKLFPTSPNKPAYGSNIAGSLDTFTGSDATLSNNAWAIAEDGYIQASVTVEANSAYLVDLTVTNPYTGADEYNVPAYINISLGSDIVKLFGANDSYFHVVLTSETAGTATFKIQSVNHWTGNITGVTIRKVNSYAPALATLYTQPVYFFDGNNLAVGGQGSLAVGEANTAYGKDAQKDAQTGKWNTALGASTQVELENGIGNTAVGANSQHFLKTGCYNNALGNAAQQNITSGCWNNAVGNEAQLGLTTGCNNVNFGRRSGTALTTGNFNTHIGTWTGFTGVNTTSTADNRNTITASFQTLVGGKARQIESQSDYLTAVGFGSMGDENSTAVGAKAIARGSNSIAIGYEVETENDDQIAIGSEGQELIIAGKKIVFNQDGTVTWETA